MIKVPTIRQYKQHLRKYAQYAKSEDWVNWCAGIAELRAKRIVTLLYDYKPPTAKVLDLGCGIGLTLSIMAQEYKNSTGCDIDKKYIKATRELLKTVGLRRKIVQYDTKVLPFRPRSFDVVTSLEVIEHADDPERMLDEIAKVLKKDGILVITTANKWWPIEPHFKLLFLSYLPTRVADFYVRLSKKGESYENIKLPSYTEFRKMVEKNFFVEDLTLEIIKNYHKFSLDKERGFKVALVGNMLKFLDRFSGTPLSFSIDIAEWLLLRVSLGWVFLGRPKK